MIKRVDVDVTRTSCRDFFCHMPTMTSIADLCCEGFRYENMYKYIFAAAMLLFSQSVIADEVTQCFEKAWAHPDNGGLGLHRGGAVDLCRGATKAGEVLACFELAWAHPDNGGLGLHRGGAVDLCRGATNAAQVTSCFKNAWAHPDNGGLGLHRGGAIELCATIPRKK